MRSIFFARRAAWGIGPTLLVLAEFAGTGSAQLPLQDTTFVPATPLPDVDLVIVREKVYGAAGVDLTPYGIGTGSEDFVQSIYFRLFESNAAAGKSMAARIVFPPEITILGIIETEADLGGSVDDGALSASDQTFGIGTDPDLYSELFRGFESDGAEFVCKTSDQALVMGVSVGAGVDDFRVIIDYGTSFPPGLSFSIASYDLVSLGGVVPSLGYLVGDPLGSTLGSGDFGEVEGLLGIPLTATTPPVPDCNLPVSPAQSIYVARDTSNDSFVDSFDVVLKIPGPNLFNTGAVNPVGLTDGPDSQLYVLGPTTGFALVDAQGGVTPSSVEDKPGNNVDLTDLAGTRDLFFLRQNGVTVGLDRYDVDAAAIVGAPLLLAGIGTPLGVEDGPNGLLYVVGRTTGFVSVDPVSGNESSIGLTPPTGENVDLCCLGTRIFIARDAGSTTSVDVYDPATGVTSYDFATQLPIPTVVGITPGPDGHLHLIGQGSTGAPTYVVVDAGSGTQLEQNNCMDFAGSNVDIAFLTNPLPQGVYCTAKTSSLGCVAAIASSGTPSVSSSAPFLVTASSVNSHKAGLLFYSVASGAIPFMGGLLCAQPPLKRTPLQFSLGNAAPDCSGTFAFDFNAWVQSGVQTFVEPCKSVYAQYWYRDPQDAFGVGLSNALQFEPGI